MSAPDTPAPKRAPVTVLVHTGQSLPDALGLSPDTPLRLIRMSLLTIKRHRWYVEVKHGQ